MLRSQQRGITLIELMIVAAIVAILAAVAYPSYQAQVRKSRRAAAQGFLMEIAARQQQRMVDVRSYTTNLAALNVALPSELNGFYAAPNIDLTNAPPGFTVTLTPIGPQAHDTGCTPLELTNTGVKRPASCW